MPVQLRHSFIALTLVLSGLGACDRATDPEASEPSVSADVPASVTNITPAAPVLPSREQLLAISERAVALANTTKGSGTPALWHLSDADTTIYLFGTVHLLRPDLDWRGASVETAFQAAETIVFELDTHSPEAQSKLMTDFMSRGFYKDGRTLSAVLDDTVETAVREAFDSLGVPFSAINAQEPWMATMNMSMMQMVSEGFDPEAGVEAVLRGEAEVAGKSFAYLEEVKDQADAFDLLPETEQIEMLYSAAVTLDTSSTMLDALVTEWADGDTKGLAALAASPETNGMSEAFYDALLVNRNANWVPQIETMLETPGTVFIAVGAAHLVGADSVVAMLREDGYEVTGP